MSNFPSHTLPYLINNHINNQEPNETQQTAPPNPDLSSPALILNLTANTNSPQHPGQHDLQNIAFDPNIDM